MKAILRLGMALWVTEACSSEPSPPTTVAPSNELAATIGPEGGTLAGRADTLFEGVRLVIPPGALPSRTRVRITPTIDETPLPSRAERVGQHFRIEPLGTALSAPASLTLPVEIDRVGHFDQRESDVKVWARTDGAFRLIEPSATAEGSVTVPISEFNVAAAGVRSNVSTDLACGAAGFPCSGGTATRIQGDQLITDEPCTAANADVPGFCVDTIDIPAAISAASSGFLVENRVLYAPTVALNIGPNFNAESRFVWRRTDLTQRRSPTLPVFSQTSNAAAGVGTLPHRPGQFAFIQRSVGGIAGEEVWSSHRLAGNLQALFEDQPSNVRIPDSRQKGQNVVRTLNDALVQLGDLNFVVTSATGEGTPVALPNLANPGEAAAPSFAPTDGIWLGRSLNTNLTRAQEESSNASVFGFRAASSQSGSPGSIALPAVTAAVTSGPGRISSLDVNPRDGRLLISGFRNRPPVNNPNIGHGVWVAGPGETASPVVLQAQLAGGSAATFTLGDAVWGFDDAVWIPNYASPEIFVVDLSGIASRTSVALAQPGTPEFSTRLPRFVRALPDRSVIVVTVGGSFLRVRRTDPCAAGTSDCDGLSSNRCETNINTSPQHCGRCGNACAAAGSTPATCVAGVCGLQCATGLGNCDGNVGNSCETNVTTSTAHCGRCGNACPARANATATCAGSACGFRCNTGFGDCDGNATNGCEVDLRTATMNCGTCGRACTSANGTTSCEGSMCRLASCNAGFADCDGNATNGCETGLASDRRHCGACGNACGPVVACQSGQCGGALDVSAGGSHTCARMSDGRVRCWGNNVSGQLGDGLSAPRGIPDFVAGLENVVEVDTGNDHTCARIDDGLGNRTVHCWGRNDDGQLGDGSNSPRSSPTLVPGLTNVTDIALGGVHTCALTGGRVRCWGRNTAGQLGTGNFMTQRTPAEVPGLSNIVELAVGTSTTCARSAANTVHCWGSNTGGQLGGTASNPQPTPVEVSGLSGALEIAVGFFHICARFGDGTVRCMGLNNRGELGNGSETATSSTPVQVLGLSGAVQIAAGSFHTCARTSGGTVQCWGQGDIGQLGDGMRGDSRTPVAVVDLTDATSIDAGSAHTCARTRGGQVRCWGNNVTGQLGDDSTGTRSTPVTVTALTGSIAVDAGGSHTCEVLTDRTVRCWGSNSSGQSGAAGVSRQESPTLVNGLRGVVQVAAGNFHTCALLVDGTVQCWGSNGAHQLGDGTDVSRATPAPVSGLSNVAAISAAGNHTCALLNDGTARCWGSGDNGRLGSGSLAEPSTPSTVVGLSGAVEIAAGDRHTCARLSNGTLRCWGAGSFFQLGDQMDADRLSPVAVLGVSMVEEVDGGRDFTCARLANGSGRCWGASALGQTGSNTDLASVQSPRSVSLDLGRLDDISTGASHACAIFSGTLGRVVLCWGAGGSGQLGDGMVTASRLVPVQTLPLGRVTALTAGGGHTCARLRDLSVRCWGANITGQVGDGTTTSPRLMPVAVLR